MSANPNLGRIAQIALSVRDLDRAVAFWRDTVGLAFLFQAPNVAFFDVAGVRLMLAESETPGDPAGTVIYFDVADIDASYDALVARGVIVRPHGAPHFIAPLGAKDLWMAFLADPDGNTFALVSEVPAGSRPH